MAVGTAHIQDTYLQQQQDTSDMLGKFFSEKCNITSSID
jgi:hypothetical protein